MTESCTRVQERLAEGGREALRDDPSGRAHLAECEACLAFFDDLTEVNSILRTMPGIEPPVEVVEATRQAVAGRAAVTEVSPSTGLSERAVAAMPRAAGRRSWARRLAVLGTLGTAAAGMLVLVTTGGDVEQAVSVESIAESTEAASPENTVAEATAAEATPAEEAPTEEAPIEEATTAEVAPEKKSSPPPKRRYYKPKKRQVEISPGSIYVASNPGGIIYIDGEARGRAPKTISNLNPGEYVVEVRAPGYAPAAKNVEVKSKAKSKVVFSLKAESKPEPRSEPKPEPKVEPKPEPKPTVVSEFPKPRLPHKAHVTAAKEVMRIFRMVEEEVGLHSGMASKAKAVTFPLAKALITSMPPDGIDIYPGPMYYFIMEQMKKGASTAIIGTKLKDAHFNGTLR